MAQPNQWKPMIALLANPETRRVAAEVMLGATLESATAGLSPSKRRRVTEAMMHSGLVNAHTRVFESDVFRSILDAAPAPKKREGIDRFVDGKRIRQYPANLDERGRLLAWVATSAFDADEVLPEREVNDRLLPYSEDVAVLRRYLVDYELVERYPDGTGYTLSSALVSEHVPRVISDADARYSTEHGSR